MKRIMSILLVFTIVFSMYTTTFGVKLEQSNIEVVDGMSTKTQKVRSVNLLMGGKDVYTDVPPLLYTINKKSRTLVPIRFVVENLGAKIEWNQEKREATITTGEKIVVLTVDSAVASVNGKKVNLPNNVPTKLLGYQGNFRTMVPLRFVAEQLGMDVGWIQETTTATVDFPKQSIISVEYDDTKVISQMVIKTTGMVDFTSMYLQGSKYGSYDRLVLDIPNSNFAIKDDSFEESNGLLNKTINMDGIKAIRGSIFENSPRNITRFVIDLEMPKGYHISYDKEIGGIKVEFLNSVKNIKVEKRNNAEAIVIHTEEVPIYNIMNLGNKVVVDVLNAKLKVESNEVSVSTSGIKRIRTAQFAPDNNYDKDDKIVRVVLDLEEGQNFENIFVDSEDTDILVYVNNKPLQGFDYQKQDINQSLLKLVLESVGEYYIDYVQNNNELMLKVPRDKIELKNTQLNIDDHMIKTISINDSVDNEYYYISVKLTDGTGYRVKGEQITNEITIELENRNIGASRYSGKLVVIDPGHGGKDPGTHGSRLKMNEKDLALDTALRLNKLLEEAGFKTYMTRTDDTTLDLYGRPEVANGLNADAFVSVHYNWTPNKEVSGVQTLYFENDPRDNKTFARIVQEEMVKGLNATDRNIVDRPNLVVIRETNMPAVLAEMGFVSNAREEELAATESYRQKSAQALFNGIKRYFDEIVLK
ncbi:N-acetylmuramoyl-L-alanine amidase [Marinisporobacter balticus]|uniref:N-acetylmuramoyl-L-alanine amidase n=1 Tax=Marinisporobacter balticus TaxID=2018667 RepID=A0A4R2KCM7_9FIRM|nr:N-acetylmuramoyl-L-alanine amidase [Marinisporobacter balticus]TCO69857.1 N-acetylmuramoyl-L-alanine amidase [Marinisporobacter balticus]